MTMLFADSFDHYATAEILRKWDSQSGSPAITAGTKRNGAQSLSFASGFSYLTWQPESGFTSAQCILGFAFRFDSSYTFTAATGLIYFYDDTLATVQASIYINTSRKLEVRRSTTGILDTSVTSLLADTWYYLEVKMKISQSTSADDVIVRVDETEVINLAPGSDTQTTSFSTMANFRLGRPTSAGGGGTLWMDDLYLLDWEGSDNNDFLGDVIVELIQPSGNGNSSDFLGSDADKVDNYLHVDDATPDDDATYVESSTLTEKDTYAFDDLANTPNTIFGVAVNLQGRKTEQTARSVKSQTRVNATDYEGDEQFLAVSYGNHQYIWENNPDDAAAWEEADVNGAEFGIKVHA